MSMHCKLDNPAISVSSQPHCVQIGRGSDLPARDAENTTAKEEANEKLPFDVLYEIFECYASTETPSHPLETLLLVCKFWSRAASSCSTIWTTFKIDAIDSALWCSRLPLRLNRSSPTSLLDIHISFNQPPLQNLDECVQHLLSVVDLLTGSGGEVAQRWQRIVALDNGRLDLEQALESHSVLSNLFYFPTPSLEEVVIQSIVSTYPMLPFAPRLRFLRVLHCRMAVPPTLSQVSELSISSDSVHNCGLGSAVGITKLEITDTVIADGYSLDSFHPQLETLSLSKYLFPEGLQGFSAPSLAQLSLAIADGIDFSSVIDCSGLPLTNLQELRLSAKEIASCIDINIYDYFAGVRNLLCATRVKVLVLSDGFIASVVLKLLTGDCESLYQDNSLILRFRGNEIILGQGDHRHHSVEAVKKLDEEGIIIGTLEDMEIYLRSLF